MQICYITWPCWFSFSPDGTEDAIARNEVEVANVLYEVLTQFYQVFPELSSHDLYVTGESYGGKYVPALAWKIHQMNNKYDGTTMLPLKGLAIGQALFLCISSKTNKRKVARNWES